MKTTLAALVAAAMFGGIALAGTANAAPITPTAAFDTSAVIQVKMMTHHRHHGMTHRHHRHMMMHHHHHHMMRHRHHHMH